MILCKGKEEIERANSLNAENNKSLSPSVSSSSLHRRLAQTDADTQLISNPVSDSDIHAALLETQMSVEELQKKAKVCLQNILLLFEPLNEIYLMLKRARIASSFVIYISFWITDR